MILSLLEEIDWSFDMKLPKHGIVNIYDSQSYYLVEQDNIVCNFWGNMWSVFDVSMMFIYVFHRDLLYFITHLHWLHGHVRIVNYKK